MGTTSPLPNLSVRVSTHQRTSMRTLALVGALPMDRWVSSGTENGPWVSIPKPARR